MAPQGCVDIDDGPRPDVGVATADEGVPPVGVPFGVFICSFIGDGRGGVVMLDGATVVAVGVAAVHFLQ